MEKVNKLKRLIRGADLERSTTVDFAIALGLVAVATIFNLWIWPGGSDQDGHYFALVAAVLVSALFGGLWPALVATALGGVSSVYYSLPPQFSLAVPSSAAADRLTMFIVEGVLLSAVASLIRSQPETASSKSRWQSYIAIPFAVGAAVLPKLLLSDLGRELPFAFNFAAVSICAWTGGLFPGIIATAILAGSTRYFFLAPLHSLSVASATDALRVGLFVGEGLFVAVLGENHVKLRRFAAGISNRVRALASANQDHEDAALAIRAVSRDTIWEWDLETGEISRTPSWQDALSTALPQREDFVEWADRIHPDDRHSTLTRLHRAIDEGRQELRYTYRLQTPKGYLNVEDHTFVVRGVDWKPLRVIGRSAELPPFTL